VTTGYATVHRAYAYRAPKRALWLSNSDLKRTFEMAGKRKETAKAGSDEAEKKQKQEEGLMSRLWLLNTEPSVIIAGADLGDLNSLCDYAERLQKAAVEAKQKVKDCDVNIDDLCLVIGSALPHHKNYHASPTYRRCVCGEFGVCSGCEEGCDYAGSYKSNSLRVCCVCEELLCKYECESEYCVACKKYCCPDEGVFGIARGKGFDQDGCICQCCEYKRNAGVL
jgi:hypothetical protein